MTILSMLTAAGIVFAHIAPALTPAPAPAVTLAAAEEPGTRCEDMAQLSENIMKARQSGRPMTQVMTLGDGADEATKNLLRAMILEAYEAPRFTTDEYQRRAAEDFANDWAAACYRTEYGRD